MDECIPKELVGVAMSLLSDREGCEVYVVCSVVLSVCLVTDWFSRSQHSRPSLEKSHCRVCVSSGSQGRHQTRRFTAPQEF